MVTFRLFSQNTHKKCNPPTHSLTKGTKNDLTDIDQLDKKGHNRVTNELYRPKVIYRFLDDPSTHWKFNRPRTALDLTRSGNECSILWSNQSIFNRKRKIALQNRVVWGWWTFPLQGSWSISPSIFLISFLPSTSINRIAFNRPPTINYFVDLWQRRSTSERQVPFNIIN